ncbi:hypothetical protein GGF31_002398 [Allomyces arbusculus]|nr:hypothetical protein GGF31_002398 [Allomyces arbusculus]
MLQAAPRTLAATAASSASAAAAADAQFAARAATTTTTTPSDVRSTATSSTSTTAAARSPPPLTRGPVSLHHASANTLDFYASLIAAVALHLWARRPLPSTPTQCGQTHDQPLTALVKHLLVTTKLPLEQFYLALKLMQVLTASYPELTTVSKPGSEIRVTMAAVILTNKISEDNYISKRSWARVSSLALAELNKMELEILDGLHWHLEIPQQEYNAWIQWLRDLALHWRKIYRSPADVAATRNVPPSPASPVHPGYPPLVTARSSGTAAAAAAVPVSTGSKGAVRLDPTQALTSPPVSPAAAAAASGNNAQGTASAAVAAAATAPRRVTGRPRARSDSVHHRLHQPSVMPPYGPPAVPQHFQQPLPGQHHQHPTPQSAPGTAVPAPILHAPNPSAAVTRFRSQSHSIHALPPVVGPTSEPASARTGMPHAAPADSTCTGQSDDTDDPMSLANVLAQHRAAVAAAASRQQYSSPSAVAAASGPTPATALPPLPYPPPTLQSTAHHLAHAPPQRSRRQARTTGADPLALSAPRFATDLADCAEGSEGCTHYGQQARAGGMCAGESGQRIATSHATGAWIPAVPVSHLAMAAVVPIQFPPTTSSTASGSVGAAPAPVSTAGSRGPYGPNSALPVSGHIVGAPNQFAAYAHRFDYC